MKLQGHFVISPPELRGFIFVDTKKFPYFILEFSSKRQYFAYNIGESFVHWVSNKSKQKHHFRARKLCGWEMSPYIVQRRA